MFSVFCCLLKVLRSRKLFCLGCSLVVGSSANGSVSASGRVGSSAGLVVRSASGRSLLSISDGNFSGSSFSSISDVFDKYVHLLLWRGLSSSFLRLVLSLRSCRWRRCVSVLLLGSDSLGVTILARIRLVSGSALGCSSSLSLSGSSIFFRYSRCLQSLSLSLLSSCSLYSSWINRDSGYCWYSCSLSFIARFNGYSRSSLKSGSSANGSISVRSSSPLLDC